MAALLVASAGQLRAQCCSYTYQQQVEPDSSAATFGVALADFDGDGDNDVVSVSAYYGIDIYMNDGAGTFTLDSIYATCSSCDFYGVHAVDVDGDADMDVVAVPFYTSANLTILTNNGSGVFTVTSFTTNTATYNGEVGDIDGDNDIDVILPHATGSTGQVFVNNGNGVFTLNQSVSNLRGRDAALGDLNGDGFLDIFSTSPSIGNMVFINDTLGNFSSFGSAFGANSEVVALGDLDNDGDLDAVVGLGISGSSQTEIYLNDGTGSFTLKTSLTTGSYSKGVKLFDEDADGYLDLFLCFYSSNPQVWHNDSLTFTSCFTGTVASGSHGMDIGFIDQNSSIDMYVGHFSNTDGDYVFLSQNPTIDYPNSPFCSTEQNLQSVVQTGAGGGTYSASPTGLSINSVSGEVDPSASTSGIYTVSYNVSGCIVNTQVEVIGVDISVVVNGYTITANQDSATYQWLDCNHLFIQVGGATSQAYTPLTSGSFAVEIMYKGCVDTSACEIINYTALADLESDKIRVYPNPASNILHADVSPELIGDKYTIKDIFGRDLSKGYFGSTHAEIDVSAYSPNLYIITVDNTDIFILFFVE